MENLGRGHFRRWHVCTLVNGGKERKLNARSVVGVVMELGLVVVVLIVAGALIPGNLEILFYH